MPQTLVVPALARPSRTKSAARAIAQLAEEDDRALGARLAELAKALRTDALTRWAPLARAAGLPLGEVLASPFALRMVALGVRAGATTVHAELRRTFEWLAPYAAIDEVRDPAHGTWERGVLREGKYQQFAAEEPFAIHHPDHHSKWAPHELLHRACGFFFRADATRFEIYLGARLNELLPVATWYGHEQALRLAHDGPFDREAAKGDESAHLRDARWLDDRDRDLGKRALGAASLLRWGLTRAHDELAAVDRERRTGELVRVPHAFLDASSDALAYAAAHAPRLAYVSDALALLWPEGEDRDASIAAYRARIERMHEALLFEPIELDLARAASLRAARDLSDVMMRAAHLGAFERVARFVPDVRALHAAARAGEAIETAALRTELARALGAKSASIAIANGHFAGAGGVSALALSQLEEGLMSTAPRTLSFLSKKASLALLRALAGSASMLERAPLGARLAAFLAADPEIPPALAELARLEAAIAAASRADDRLEQLCEDADALPPAWDGVWLVRSRAMRVIELAYDAASTHAAEDEPLDETPSPTRLFVGTYQGAVSLMPAPVQVERALPAIDAAPADALEVLRALDEALAAEPTAEEHLPSDGDGWLRELIGAGVVGWMRAPR